MLNNQLHPISIGRNIERLRKVRGMKQEELAEAIGISRQTLSKIEQSDKVDEEKLQQIAAALGVTADAIRNFNAEQTFNYVQNNYDGSSDNYSGLHNCTFNPLEKLMQMVDENRSLYQQLIQVEREKTALLETFLNKGK